MDRAQIPRAKPRAAAIVCGLLLIAFAIISYSAALTKNATIDEPTHAISGWLALRHGDFRVETVNPPLWKCWAGLGNLLANPPLRHDSTIWKNRTWDPVDEVTWSSRTLYDSTGFDGDAFINRARAMMLALGVLLGVLIARWSYRLAGPVAAVVATALFCFDPTFIAHTSLVKSDVAFALVYLLIAYSAWRVGERVNLWRLLAVGLLCGLAINVKFSGVIVGPVVALMLAVRALLAKPWIFFNRELRSRISRLGGAFLTGIFAAICCVVVTWACYGLRYRPAPSPAVHMDMQAIYDRAQVVETTADLMRSPTAAEIAGHPPSPVSQAVRWADVHHLLPQAMLAGFLYQHTCVQLWPAFLNGQLYGSGRWTYFPLAFFYKTPVSELAAIFLGSVVFCGLLIGILKSKSMGRRPLSRFDFHAFWLVSCLMIPFAVFAAAALTTHLNIGVRNILPLYPFLYVACGCAAAYAWKHRPKITAMMLAVLSVGLIGETTLAWPNYIAFFNAPSGGSIGGLAHLSDSNLDWGQDIKSLAIWQKSHADLPMYAKLYETVDPHFYGLQFHPLIISRTGEPASDVPMAHGWIAVSATHLQGLYTRPWETVFYDRLLRIKPAEIINGTIYIYEYRVSG